jgi:hypothetical protein
MDLVETFRNDVIEIAKDLIKAFDLKYEQKDPALSNPLVRWFDFTVRYIEQRPRTVIRSSSFSASLDPAVVSALTKIEKLIETGADINPYQSKGLIVHNDTSSTKRQQRTDFLFADWGIHHFHLTSTPIKQGEYFSERSEWLLFCIFGHDFAGLIDVRHHDEEDLFSDKSLFEAIVTSWPELVEKFRLNAVAVTSHLPQGPKELAALRKGGITSFVTVGTETYMGPGMGVTSASTSTRASLALTRTNRLVHDLAKWCSDEANPPLKDMASIGISDPDFHLGIHAPGLCIHERKSNRAYNLPRSITGSWMAELNDLLAPEWAVLQLLARATNPGQSQ